MQRNLYSYAYLDLPYERVDRLLRGDPLALLQDATTATGARADIASTHLHVDIGSLEIGRDAAVRLGQARDLGDRAVSLPLQWDGGEGGGLFPAMEGFLEAADVATRPPITQLSFVGHYRPPLGVLGALGDAGGGRRIAEMAVHHFLADVVQRVEALLQTSRSADDPANDSRARTR